MLAFAMSWVCATNVSAEECPKAPADEDETRRLAGRWFSKGEARAAEGEYEAAVEAFACSSSIVEHPATVFNAAQAARLAGDHEQAAAYLRRFLESSPEGEMAEEAREALVEIEELLSEAEPAPPNEETPAAGQIDERFQEDQRGVAAQDGDTRARTLIRAGKVSAMVGGGLVLIGAVFQGLAAKSWSDGKNATRYDDFREAEDDMQRRQGAAIGFFAVGAAAAGTGAVLILLGEKNEEDGGAKSGIRVIAQPDFIGLSGRF